MVAEELKRGAAEQSRLLADVKRLSSELDEAKSQLVVAGFRLESDLQDEKRKCQEEIASLQQIVQGITHCRLLIEVNHIDW
jgi:Rab GTPase-binding effector protein 1